MEQPITSRPLLPTTTFSWLDSKMIIIYILLLLLVLATLGVNFVGGMQWLGTWLFSGSITALQDAGIITGKAINTSADAVSDVAKGTIDIGDNAIKDIGNLVTGISQQGIIGTNTNLGQAIESKIPQNQHIDVQPSVTTDNILTQSWCYIGDYNNTRGCMSIRETDKCMSGQVFPSKSACLSNSTGNTTLPTVASGYNKPMQMFPQNMAYHMPPNDLIVSPPSLT